MVKHVQSNNKVSKKVTAAIRLRMNRELVEDVLLTTLNSVDSIIDGAFLNETITEKEANELSSSLAEIKALVHNTFCIPRVQDDPSTMFPNATKTCAELDYDAAVNWLKTFELAKSPIIRTYARSLLRKTANRGR